MATPLIEFKNVTKRFDGKTVLDGVNTTIGEGQVTTIIGKSGSGKSVLLKHIIGLLEPDDGELLFRGKSISSLTKSEKGDYLKRISYMFQNNALFDSMTVFENVALPLEQTTGLNRDAIREKVMDRLEQAELAPALDKYPGQLSGGMQKRVALSRALVTDPQIVLFDEPTSGQDPVRRNAILAMIAEYQKRFHFTAVLISHDIPDVFFISNRVLVLYNGRIIFNGTPEELDEFEHPFMDEFITSLEVMQKNLSELYSRRTFKVRYRRMLSQHKPHRRFVVAVFSLDDYDTIGEYLGHTTAQKVVRALGNRINKHFDALGGFSTRQSRDVFITVLPHSDMNEAKGIVGAFKEDLNEKGLADIRTEARVQGRACFDFAVSAGLAGGGLNDEMNDLVKQALAEREQIAAFQCEGGRAGSDEMR